MKTLQLTPLCCRIKMPFHRSQRSPLTVIDEWTEALHFEMDAKIQHTRIATRDHRRQQQFSIGLTHDLCAQAILFYDNLVSIDNYKVEFRNERAMRFGFINFLALTGFSLSAIDESAKKEGRRLLNLKLEVENSLTWTSKTLLTCSSSTWCVIGICDQASTT